MYRSVRVMVSQDGRCDGSVDGHRVCGRVDAWFETRSIDRILDRL